MKQKLLSCAVLLLCLLTTAYAQAQQVTGVVKSDDGETLAGVSVVVRGTTVTTSTDADGRYSIAASDNAVLVFRYLGYLNQEIRLTGQQTVNVTLMSEDHAIEEVVVTGVGLRVDKRAFTGATSQISGEDAQIGGMIDPSRGLEGRVSGVTVQNVTGTFGTAPKIRVRGATSIYGSSKPLWVLDGIIIEDVADVSADDLASGDALTLISSAVAGLNANDIESFQILKDGSATSIYGAKAMAGVIVITTKKGSAGRSSISYSGEYTSRAIPKYSEFNIMNSQQQMAVYQEMQQKGYLGLAGVTNASSRGEYGRLYDMINNSEVYNDTYLGGKSVNAMLREAEYRNTDWFSELFSTTLQHNHSLSLSSGNAKSQYYASVSAMGDEGWAKSSSVNRYTANLNANFNILENLRLNVITGGSYRDQMAPGTLGQTTDVVFGEVKRDFDINPYSYAMNTSRTLDPNRIYRRNYTDFNILHELDNNYMDVVASDIRFQGELRWKALRNLEFSALGSIRFQNTQQHHHIKDGSNQAMAYRAGLGLNPGESENTTIRDNNPYLYEDPTDPYAVPVSVLTEGGIYNRTDHNMRAQQYRFTAQYDETFADKHSVTLFGLVDLNSYDRNNTWFRAWGLQYDMGEIPFSNYLVFKRGQEENTPYFRIGNTRSREAAFGGMGSYTYDSKYTLTGTYRYEGSNRLGRATSARWMPTWNLSGGWNVHNELFFDNVRPYLSNLFVRASYSLTGDRGPSFVTNSRTVIGGYTPWRPSTGDSETGLAVVDLENGELTYEKKHELNVGFDAGFFDNRINIEFDAFKRNNFDLIGVVNTQGMGGQISKFGNVAEMSSRGVELGVTANIIRNDNFGWTSSFIYSNITNKVEKLETDKRVIDLITGFGFAQEGDPHRALYSIPFVRLNNEGLPVFLNESGDETITGVYFQERERLDFLKYEGSVEPTQLGSFGNIFSYKNFRLNVFFTYSFGNVVRLAPVFQRSYSDLVATPKEFENRWVLPGDEEFTNVPAFATIRQNRNNSNLSYAYNAYNYSTVRVASGDFIRLKDLSLGYEFPTTMIAPWKLNSLNLRFNATNPFLIYADKKLNGQDPEFINSGGVAAPIPRQYTLTLRVGL